MTFLSPNALRGGRASLAVAAVAAFAVPVLHARRAPGDLTGPWHLFFDNALVASDAHVHRTYHAFHKYPGNPILVPDRPWEKDVVHCTTVLSSPSGRGFQMWYYCWTPRNDPDRSHFLYATSPDGIHWHEPSLGVVAWKVNGSKANNIIAAGGSVMYTPRDSNPAQRYKAISPNKYYFSGSPDGVHWHRLTSGPAFKAGDTGIVMWDPHRHLYRAYAKIDAWVDGLRCRSIGYSQTTNYADWPALHLVMAPDDRDNRWVRPGSVQRTHFYDCPVVLYQNTYLGFLSIFRADDHLGFFHGPIFDELATSRDGIHWWREEGVRPPILANGPPGSWDHGMVGVASVLNVGDQVWLYYTGYDGLHDYLPFHSGIGVAMLRKGGFVSLDGGDVPGIVVTRPLLGMSGELHVNAAARNGLVQVAVLDAAGRVFPGYRRKDCRELRDDGVNQIVAWAHHPMLPSTTQPLRLKFYIRNASLYGFKAGPKVRAIRRRRAPPLLCLYTFEGGRRRALDDAVGDGRAHHLRFMGAIRVDRNPADAAFGRESVHLGSPWRPDNRVRIGGTRDLGAQFTLGVMARSADNRHARLFSSYRGVGPVKTTDLIFDDDPGGTAFSGLRLICKGIAVTSRPVRFADGRYHHLCVTYDNGRVRFYLDGCAVGGGWVPGGAPVVLAHDLRVGDDLGRGLHDDQFTGNMDDIIVYGRALPPAAIKVLATRGAAAFFAHHSPPPHSPRTPSR